MTEVIRRRSRRNQAAPDPGPAPTNTVQRHGCTSCFHSFYAVPKDVVPCPVCDAQAELIPAYGPVPGKFTKKNQTGKESHAVIMTLRLSQDTADRLDQLRGETKRATWLRETVERAVSEEADVPST